MLSRRDQTNPENPDMEKIKLLYVDDEPSLLFIARRVLEDKGEFVVDTAGSVRQAITNLTLKEYDVIISDYQMPEMDGIEFLKKLRTMGIQTPFIIFTGRGREEVVIEALNSGADFYLQKGGDVAAQFAELQSKIRQAVSRRRTEEALKKSEKRYHSLFEHMQEGMAYCRMIFDLNGEPDDWVYLSVNPAFERLTGLVNITGKLATQAIPGIKNSNHELFEIYGRVAKTGKPEVFRVFFRPLMKWLYISVFCPEQDHFVAVFDDITEFTHAREALEESEERFRSLIHNSSDLIRIIDQAGRIRYSSPSNEKILGYAQKELEGKSPFDFIHPEDRSLVERAFHEVLTRTNPGTPTEFRMRKSDGEYIYVDSVAVNLIGVTGIDGIVTTTRPIGGRKRAEDIIRERERVLSTLISNLPGFVYRCANDPNWTMEFISDGCFEITGYTPGELIGNKIIAYNDIIRPDYRGPIWKSWQDLLDKHEVFEEEYPIITKSGGTRWVWERGRGIFSVGDVLLFLEGFIIDITDRRMLEEEKKVSRVRMESAMALGNFAWWEIRMPGGEITIENGKPQIIGYDHSFFVNYTDVMKLIHPEDHDRVTLAFSNHITGKSVGYFAEYRILAADGIYRWVRDIGKVTKWSHDKSPDLITGFIVDLTGQKQTETALLEANKKLGLLSSLTRHDISNQLTIIKGSLALIMDSSDPAAEVIEHSVRAENAATVITGYIDFMKNYEQIGVKSPQWQGVGGIIDRQHPGQILIKNKVTGLIVYADPMFEFVISNLIDNTWRHGESATEIRFSGQECRDGYLILVCDDGVGIPAGIKEMVFDRYYGRNTGLGLFLIREILEITGITIRETGEPGKGACFEIFVPKGAWRFEGDQT